MPLLDLDWNRLLLTHGPSLPSGGKAGLRAGIEAPIWFHRP
jgi:hypothetical protein